MFSNRFGRGIYGFTRKRTDLLLARLLGNPPLTLKCLIGSGVMGTVPSYTNLGGGVRLQVDIGKYLNTMPLQFRNGIYEEHSTAYFSLSLLGIE